MELYEDKSPHTVSAVLRAFKKINTRNHTRKLSYFEQHLDRSLLPTPAKYYAQQFAGLKIKSEWVKVKCCFHSPDNNPSLSISMIDGHFKCFACEAKGTDIIAFHRQRYGLSFEGTCRALGVWNE